MIWLYRTFMSVVLALVYPYGRLRAAFGSKLWRGRLGLIDPRDETDIWMHAASVGETKVLSYLIAYLREKKPDLRIHFTVITSTGFQTARSTFCEADDTPVTVSFFSLDANIAVKRTLDRLRPKMVVVAETEIWPNLIAQCSARSIPLVLVNGRMSESSFGRYRLITKPLSSLLSRYSRFFFKTEQDQERYAHFGVKPEKSVVAGDMKLDAPLLPRSEDGIRQMRHQLGVTEEQFIFVAGSTRPGEEEILLDAYRAVRDNHPRIRLVLAPRHLERLNEIRALLESRNITYYLYGQKPLEDAVILIERMGILNDIYMAADLAFVGGTLVDIGGHNILEPVWAGTPVLFGPYLNNVTEAAEYITDHDYGQRVESSEEMTALLEEIISGARTFERKTADHPAHSAAAEAGSYILEQLCHA